MAYVLGDKIAVLFHLIFILMWFLQQRCDDFLDFCNFRTSFLRLQRKFLDYFCNILGHENWTLELI